MPKYECIIDVEARTIAEELIKTYPQNFSGIDLDKIAFVRVTTKKVKRVSAKTVASKPPEDMFHDKSYIVQIYSANWDVLSAAQRNLLVFRQLFAIEDGGCDESSNNFKKIRKTDVNDYSIVLAASGMNMNWAEQGQEITNILENKTEKPEKKSKKDKEEDEE